MALPDLDERDDLSPAPPQVPRLEGMPAKMPIPAPALAAMPLPAQRLEPKEFDLRPGDPGEDRPTQTPAGLLPLSEEDRKALLLEEERQLQRELREAEELLASEPTLLGLPGYLSHPLMGAIVIGLGALLGIFLFNQITQAVSAIANLTGFWMYAGYGGLSLLGVGVGYSALRLLWFYFRLRRNKQLRIKGLEELEKRTKLRWLVNAKLKGARVQLEAYLREFPLLEGRGRKRLLALGITEDVTEALLSEREKLLDAQRWGSDDVWFAAFRDLFQSRLDDAAGKRVNYWARRTAVGTAVSPNTLTDTAIVFYYSFIMLADLCVIYNLHAGRLGTAVLLARVFFNAYLAGQLNEMENMTAEQIQSLVAPHIPASELLMAKVLGKVGAKASAGVINYFLLVRLGKSSTRMLRPVTRD